MPTGPKIPQAAEWVLERLPAKTDASQGQHHLLDDSPNLRLDSIAGHRCLPLAQRFPAPASQAARPQVAGPHPPGVAYRTRPAEAMAKADPDCSKAMHFIALIEEPLAIEKILRHLNLWCGPATFAPARPPPATPGRGEVSEIPSSAHDGDFLIETSPMPDYENVLTD